MQTKSYKRVLAIAGSDSGGGAGIQADIKTISALGCFAATALTCVTAQNTLGVQAVEPLGEQIIRQQIRSVLDDVGVDAVKIGMLGSPEIARVVALELRGVDAPIVLDPVLVATSGDVLTTHETIRVILDELMPLAAIITPNLIEARELTHESEAEAVWRSLESLGARALLLKGGHATGDVLSDYLFTANDCVEFRAERINTPNTHGTGCTLSSAIAAYLALGFGLEDAVAQATGYIHKAIATAAEYRLGHGHGPVHHFFRFWE